MPFRGRSCRDDHIGVQVAGNTPTHHHPLLEVPNFFHALPVSKRVKSTRARELHASSTSRAYLSATLAPSSTHARDHCPYLLPAPVDCATSTLLTVDLKFDQVLSDFFSRPDSIFVVCFSIRNLDMPGDEISCLIHVIFYGDNFAQCTKAMRSYLKHRKLWLYVSSDRPIPEKVDKETDSAYAIWIEDWESVNHHIITWFIIHLFHPLLMSLSTLILLKKFGTYLLLGMLD